MAVTELKEHEWEKFSKSDYAVIDCYGDFCTACVMLKPIFEDVSDDIAGVDFGKVNVSQYPEIADKFGVDALPMLLFFRKGELVNTQIGSIDRGELLDLVAELLYD